MSSIAQTLFRDSEFGVVQDLPKVGSSLEIPLVYDDAARELRRMAADGLIEIVDQGTVSDGENVLIDRLQFKRVR